MKNELRRLRFLCSRRVAPSLYYSTLPDTEESKPDVLEIRRLFKRLGFSDKDALYFWSDCHMEYFFQKQAYLRKPAQVKKDNKDCFASTRWNSNKNKIRYPRKVRKTAWKRFYKLFPHLKERQQ